MMCYYARHWRDMIVCFFFFFQAEDGIRDKLVTGVQTCALPICFADAETPREFCDDWVGVAAEEAEHFALLADRLAAPGAAYGELPAHDGLWEAAAATAHDLLARLAVVPLRLAARGLDVTPEMICRLGRAGDARSAAILRRIYEDEIGHVAVCAGPFARPWRGRGPLPATASPQRGLASF